MKEFQKMFQVNKLKRFLTMMLAVAMFVTAIPTTAFAAEVQTTNLEQNNETTEVTEATEGTENIEAGAESQENAEETNNENE